MTHKKNLEEVIGNPRNFIEEEIENDIRDGKYPKHIHTRFPPEPNGFLHVGHAKAICLNFGIAEKYGGKTNLRFDDTNPSTEDTTFVDAIRDDIHWLGFDWEGREYYASDYFDQLYGFAIDLIHKDLAYIDELSMEEIAEHRGVPTKPGKESPYRNRPREESLDLFEKMKNGELDEGSCVLRAKVDMTSPNMHMRDPILYRIKKEAHHRTGDKWCIYPMYDFAHGQSDSIEEITHSLCSLEFKHHRPLYNWFIEKLEIFPSRQIEFARMNVAYMITSKRKLAQLIEQGKVDGWDDPRMSTISGMRRRGYGPAAIREFCDKVGIAKRDNVIDIALLESCVREELNKVAPRVMVVLDPLKVTITNYPEGSFEQLEVENNPEDDQAGTRAVPFERHIYIEREDFMIDPPRKFFRLGPGRNVRLKSAYIIQCTGFEMDEETGMVKEVFCTYYPDSRSGQDTSGIKAKGTLHWVSESDNMDVEVRMYDRLFTDPAPDAHEGKSFVDFYNEDSLQVIPHAKAEHILKESNAGDRFQFMRKGYFVVDKDSTKDHIVFNRTVTLKDTWKKIQNR
jgi:glutaminyl-tRNA synthetase